MSNKEAPKVPADEPRSMHDKAGEKPEKTEDEKLLEVVQSKSVAELERMKKAEQRPIQVKRKTLSDALRKDTTAMTLTRMATASYDEELNKYNFAFQQADHA